MLTLFATILSISLFYGEARSQFCVCSETYVVVNNSADCFRSSDYDLQNACFNCPVTLSGGSIENRCMSLIREGYRTCGQSGALVARQDACSAMGGNIASPEFKCSTTLTGTNISQLSCTTTPPTASTTPTSGGSTPTNTPTSGSSNTVSNFMFMVFVVVFCCLV
jgi:hypothetical protein